MSEMVTEAMGQRSLFQELLDERVPVIFDGAMGTQIQAQGIGPDDFEGHDGCNEILNLTRPDAIVEIHKRYLLSGANVIETNTFGANRIKLGDYGLSGRVHEINSAAAALARRAVMAACARHACLVCGTMGPTGRLPSAQGINREKTSFDEIAEVYKEQAAGLLDGGADMLLLETMQDLLEARAAMYGIRELLRERNQTIPLQVHSSIDSSGRTLLGGDIFAFLGAVGNLSPAAIGFNCGVGPIEMKPFIRQLLVESYCPVSMMPNAGMPENINGTAVYRMTPERFAAAIAPLVMEGLSIVGGCCGTTPEHIRALSALLEGKKTAPRTVTRRTFVATGISGIALESPPKPVIIGERLNAQGSKKTKELVLAGNFDELYQIAREQAGRGALLDLCVAVNERDDEKETMAGVVAYLSQRIATPLCLDSTEPAVFAAALRACPGSALINSINYERDGGKALPILELARDFGCPVIALTIDDDGMAKTITRKLDIARRLVDLACGRFGLPPQAVYIDPLIFTLAAGDPESVDAAQISLEAIFRIHYELPQVRTIMGISNVSFGLKPAQRRALNNLMLYHATRAGLDAAIFNPLHLDNIDNYIPKLRVAGENLLFNRSPAALTDFVKYFDAPAPRAQSAVAAAAWKEGAPSLGEQLRAKVVGRDRRNLSELIEALLTDNRPEVILTTMLLPAMAEVGDAMARGEMILPFVLQAAEVMKEALAILEPHLAKAKVPKRGTIVLATVYGDVHDIGKNLVASILKNQGFEIIDLGKQVPVEAIIEAAAAAKADAIGLSALLVTTSREMRHCVEACARRGLSVPIVIGGAAVNRLFAERIAIFDGGERYSGGVFYAKDAFEAMHIFDEMKKGSAASPAPHTTPGKGAGGNAEAVDADDERERAPQPLEHPGPLVPPFYGTGEILQWQAQALMEAIDTKRLFKGYWGGGNAPEKEYEKSVGEVFLPAFTRLKEEILTDGLLDARGLYGFFSVYTDGPMLYLLDPGDFHTEIASFRLPRVPRKIYRSLADYFRPEGDLIAVQVVTIGRQLDERASLCLTIDNKYADGFFLNGIGNYLTEHLAGLVTQEIRKGLLLPKERGRRYSFGYPGLPGVEEQAKLFEILAVEERLGITLTAGFQMVPEHSTMGIFIHHPQAEYM